MVKKNRVAPNPALEALIEKVCAGHQRFLGSPRGGRQAAKAVPQLLLRLKKAVEATGANWVMWLVKRCPILLCWVKGYLTFIGVDSDMPMCEVMEMRKSRRNAAGSQRCVELRRRLPCARPRRVRNGQRSREAGGTPRHETTAALDSNGSEMRGHGRRPRTRPRPRSQTKAAPQAKVRSVVATNEDVDGQAGGTDPSSILSTGE